MSKDVNYEKSQMLINETLDSLRNKPVKSTYMERITLMDHAETLYKKLPQPLYFGYGVNYVLANVSCPVKSQDILVGRVAERVPTVEEEDYVKRVFIREMEENGFDWFYLTYGGHINFAWKEILTLGINGYIQKAEKTLQRLNAEGAEEKQLVFMQGMVLVYNAYRRYILRYAEAAEAIGLPDAAESCRRIADTPPQTFRDAMQLMLLITIAYSVFSSSCNANVAYGRIDNLLLSYYEQDIAAERLTEEEAGYIIDDFQCKLALLIGRGEHQLSDGEETSTGWFRNPMYDHANYMIIGGYSNDGKPQKNPLTRLFLERIQPRFENPLYIFRCTKEVEPELWEVVCDKLRQNASLFIYNDETVIPALEHAGVELKDARDYVLYACNWPDMQGSNYSDMSIVLPIPHLILENLQDEEGNLKKRYVSLEELYQDIEKSCRDFIRSAYHRIRKERAEEPLSPKRLVAEDCFMQDAAENAQSLKQRAKYRFVALSLRNIGSAADMMASLESLVFSAEQVSLETMIAAVKENFVGYEDLLVRCKKAPKYGQDDDRADKHATRLMQIISEVMEEEAINPVTGEKDLIALAVFSNTYHISDGARIGATPDGRLAGEPLSENLAPAHGNSKSVTELMNSLLKLPFQRIATGAVNIKMPKNLVSGEEGLERLKILLQTYFERGGMQVQLNVTDTRELKEAQIHPEKYQDLLVRVTGYSAVFVDMGPVAQAEMIRRNEVS